MVVGAPVVDEETGGGTVVGADVVDADVVVGAEVVDADVVDEGAGAVVDDDVVEAREAPVVEDGGAVVTGRLVVDAGRVVVGRVVVVGGVVSGASEVVEPPAGNSAVVVPAAIMARVSTGSAAGSPARGRLEVVEDGGSALEVGTSTAVIATAGIVASVRVASGERSGHQRTIATSAMAARVTAIRAFSIGRAIRTSPGNESTLAFLDETTDVPVPTKC